MQLRKRRWWTRSITWLSLIAISGALLSGLFQLAVALAPGYRETVATRASIVLGQPVQVDALALRWRWLKPLLELKGVRLMAATLPGSAATQAPIVDIERIRLGFALVKLLGGEWIPTEVEIEGVALAAEITPEGAWRLRGRSQTRPPPSFEEVARTLKRFSRLRVEQLMLSVVDRRDAKGNFSASLQRADLRLDARGFELRAELQAPQVAATRLRLRAGIAGDLATPETWRGRWTLDASGIAPGRLLQQRAPMLARVQWGDATLTASGDWLQGAPGASELSLRAQSMKLADEPDSALRDVDVGLHYRPSPQGGTLDVAPLRLVGRKGLWPVTTARLDWKREAAEQPLQWRINSDFLRLDDLGHWLAAFAPSTDALPPQLFKSLHGDLAALEARWQPVVNTPARYSLHTRFSSLAATWPEHGSVQGLNGEITADDSGGRTQLKSESLGFELPKVFEGPQRATHFAAEASWKRDGDDWQLTLPQLDWSLLGSTGRATAELRLPQAAPALLKLQARFDVADVAALKPVMPVRWGQPLKDWLDRAVVRGRVARAVLDIDGPLADFPFHARPTGQWSLLLPLSAARLEYHRDWPGVDQLSALLRFRGNGLSFEAQRGVVNGVAVTQARGGIEDFSVSPLVIDANTTGEAPYYYSFLRASPLAARLSALLSRSEAEGPVQTDVHVEVPLHSSPEQKTVARGEVRLLGNNLRHSALDRAVTDITGTLHFGTSLHSEGLQGRFYDTPITGQIAAGADGSDQLDAAMRVDYRASNGVAARYLPRWLAPQIQGASNWRLNIPLSGPRSGRVQLSSSLEGVLITLPAPLGKTAEQSAPITLELSGDDNVPLRISGDMPGRFAMAMRFARAAAGSGTELAGLALRLGPGEAPAVPSADGWRLDGMLDTLEPHLWQPLISALLDRSADTVTSNSNSKFVFLGAALRAQRLRFGGYDLPPVQITARREFGGFNAALHGGGVSGDLRLSSNADALSGRFSSLRLDAAPKEAIAAAAAESGEPMDPTRAPTLDFTVDALNFGGHDFGQLSLATERSGNGQRLQRLALQGGIATLNAEGEWRRVRGLTEAQSKFTLTSDDLAGALEGLGFAPTVSGRNARIVGDLTWPAAARGFDWALGRGTVSLAVEDGALRMVEPGSTGRVLGLFNFYALPRRLTLDFGDVVSKGLGFDRIDGEFKLANGVAHTDDLVVLGPSVRIDLRGNIGLVAHDYNQVITVRPNTKGIALGALLIGGASAVAVPLLPVIAVIANQVIDIPIGQVTQLTYGLTGSWDNPEIKKLSQTQPPEPAATEASKP